MLYIIIIIISGCINNAKQNIGTYNKKWIALLKIAKNENKYTVVEFSTVWCMPCKILQKQVLDNDSVNRFLKRNVKFLLVDAEKGMGIALAMKYGITVYPTILIFNPKGILIYEKTGIENINSPNSFLYTINQIISNKNELPAKAIAPGLIISYPDFYTKYFENKIYPDSETIINYFKQQKDMFTEVNWAVIRVFGNNDVIQNFVVMNANKYLEMYGCMVRNTIKGKLQFAIANDFEMKDSTQYKKDLEAFLKMEEGLSAEEVQRKKYSNMLNFWAKTGLSWDGFLYCWKAYRLSYGTDLDLYCAKLVDENCGNQSVRNLAVYFLQQRIKQNSHDWRSIVGLANLIQREDVLQINNDQRLIIHSDMPDRQEKQRAEDLYERAISLAKGNRDTISVITYKRIQSALFAPNEETWEATMCFYKKTLPLAYKQYYKFYTIGYYQHQRDWPEFIRYVNEFSRQLGGFKNIHGVNAHTFGIYALYILKYSTDTNQIKEGVNWVDRLIKNNPETSDTKNYLEERAQLEEKLKNPLKKFNVAYLQ